MERALNASLDHPLLLARVDTNDVLEGKKPLMHIESGQLQLLSGLALTRSRYFSEEHTTKTSLAIELPFSLTQ